MGVPIKLVLYAADQSSANRAAEAAYRRIAQIDQTMSDYKSDSELSNLNRTAGQGKPIRVSDDLWTVLLRSQRLAEKTGGAFDVTVGPYVRLWRRARRSGEFPSAERLAEARAAVGSRRLMLNEERQTAELLVAGMRLDLGGIAAGYAADQALSALAEQGVTVALIYISGDVLVGEPPPGRDGWRVGIAPVAAPDGPPSRYLSLRRASLTTSGDAFQHVVISGKRYSHIVDPRTGVGLTDQSSVTVIAPDAMTADSLATTVSVLGPEEGLKLIEQTPGAAAIIMRNTEQGLQTYVSARFSQFEVRPPK
jgi:thiamine biosynthesis lipoprotein